MIRINSWGSIGSCYNTRFLQAPTRAEVSPNRGLLSRPLVPYVLVVKSSMAGWAHTHTHTHTHTQHRPLAPQQRRLLETPGQCCMLTSSRPAASLCSVSASTAWRGHDDGESADEGALLVHLWNKIKKQEVSGESELHHNIMFPANSLPWLSNHRKNPRFNYFCIYFILLQQSSKEKCRVRTAARRRSLRVSYKVCLLPPLFHRTKTHLRQTDFFSTDAIYYYFLIYDFVVYYVEHLKSIFFIVIILILVFTVWNFVGLFLFSLCCNSLISFIFLAIYYFLVLTFGSSFSSFSDIV